MTNPLQTLAEKSAELAHVRAATMEKLQKIKDTDGLQLGLSALVPGIDRTLAEVDARLMAICALTAEIPPDGDDTLVPKSYVESMNKSIEQLITQYKSIDEAIANLKRNRGVSSIDPTELVVRSVNGRVTIQLSDTFRQIWNISDNALVSLYNLLATVGSKGHADFSAALNAFREVMDEINQQHDQLSVPINQVSVEHTKVTEITARSSSLHEEIARLKSESESDRRTLSEYASDGTNKITSIRANTEEAVRLSDEVHKYKSMFQNFKASLEDREKLIQSGAERHTDLLHKLDKMKVTIEATIAQAEGMLSGATVAGLAGSFGQLRDDLSSELTKARKAFYWAIAFLFISALPLAAYVIPGLAEWLVPSSATARAHAASTPELVAQILARALLLLPAAWFAKFAAGRHAALFRLKEHYAYKYSVASSVEGFKKQAEPFKDAIAATTFFELTFNPAERMESGGQEGRHPNPAMELG